MDLVSGVYTIENIAIDAHKGWISANRYPIYADSSYFFDNGGLNTVQIRINE